MSVAPITCHILDTTRGKPASNVVVQLYHISSNPKDLDNSSIQYILQVQKQILMVELKLDI